MSLLSALGASPFQAPALATNARQDTGAGTRPAAAARTAPAAGGEPVALSQNGIDLSAQGLAQRVDALGNATLDVAQDFLAGFAQQLFGDAAKGATLSFDSASLSAEAGFAAMTRHSAGARGVSDSAAFSLSESAHFIGKGQITTADGQRFDFEIEVRYDARAEAAATRSGGAGQPAPPAQAAAPDAQLGQVDFPGSLDDLFALLGQPLQGEVPAADAGAADQGGTLTLRLLKLINNSNLLDPAAAPGHAQRARLLADAYGAPAPGDSAPAPASAGAADTAPASA